MNWWKEAKISDFSDRNDLNDRIDDLKAITVKLTKLAKIVFQTPSGSKQMLAEILDTKRLSTYPLIQKILQDASECCLDNPHKFADLCKRAGAEIVHRISKLEKERKEFVNKTLPNKWKGWRE